MATEIFIGKKLIEVLTLKMYHNPLIIYREYIQNSIDSIENAISENLIPLRCDSNIQVDIDKDRKEITITDNGQGLKQEKFFDTLTKIADSEKDQEKHIGQIGIGRLAGLAYCTELIMESSAKGEGIKSVLRWDCEKLRALIKNHERLSASTVINEIITFDEESEDEQLHYFSVKLKGVNDVRLVDPNDVYDYICNICPLPFLPKFYYKNIIYSKLKAIGDPNTLIKEYPVFINGKQATKQYVTVIYKRENHLNKKRKVDDITDVHTKTFFSEDDELLAFCWYTITKKLHTIERINNPGIKYRKMNMQIGGSDSLRAFFTQPRFSNYFIGELHVFHKDISPNSQRDGFQDSSALRELNVQMKAFLKNLSELCYRASEVNSIINKVAVAKDAQDDFDRKIDENRFATIKQKEEESASLIKKQQEAEKALNKLEKLKGRIPEEIKPIIRKVQVTALEDIGLNETDISNFAKSNENENEDQTDLDIDIKNIDVIVNKLSKLARKEKKLLSFVLDNVYEKISEDEFEDLIEKIVREYS